MYPTVISRDNTVIGTLKGIKNRRRLAVSGERISRVNPSSLGLNNCPVPKLLLRMGISPNLANQKLEWKVSIRLAGSIFFNILSGGLRRCVREVSFEGTSEMSPVWVVSGEYYPRSVCATRYDGWGRGMWFLWIDVDLSVKHFSNLEVHSSEGKSTINNEGLIVVTSNGLNQNCYQFTSVKSLTVNCSCENKHKRTSCRNNLQK